MKGVEGGGELIIRAALGALSCWAVGCAPPGGVGLWRGRCEPFDGARVRAGLRDSRVSCTGD